MESAINKVLDLLSKPKKVLWICFAILFMGLIIEGKIFQILSLYHQKENLEKNIAELQSQTKKLKMQIREAKHPKFIERKARNQLDLVEEGDLLFVFSD